MYQIFPGVYEIPAQYHSIQEGQALEAERQQIYKRIDEAYERVYGKSFDYDSGKELSEKEA